MRGAGGGSCTHDTALLRCCRRAAHPNNPPPAALQAHPLLSGEPKPNTAEADIALTFQQSALKSTAEADALFASMSLRWLPPDQAPLPEAQGGAPAWHPARCTTVAVPRCDAWDGLFLEAAVEWPLQLLFPPEVRAEGCRLMAWHRMPSTSRLAALRPCF